MQIPGYQLGNFLLCSLLYIGVSYRLFTLTNVLKCAFIPHSDNTMLAQNALLMLASAGALYLMAAGIHFFLYLA
jgi:N-acetylneuraminate 9-O-acetyltransferase